MHVMQIKKENKLFEKHRFPNPRKSKLRDRGDNLSHKTNK